MVYSNFPVRLPQEGSGAPQTAWPFFFAHPTVSIDPAPVGHTKSVPLGLSFGIYGTISRIVYNSKGNA